MAIALDALLQTAARISHARKTEEVGKQCAAFLQWVNSERALQLAMLADASDQVLTLVRQSDTDVPDPAEHAAFVSAFVLEGTRLWLEDHCWTCGCTRDMLRLLARPRTYLIADGTAGRLAIGGDVSDECKARCIGRMKCWFRLAIDVCHAEFPYFEAVNAFRVFDCQSARANIADDDAREPLARLASIFGCQQETLWSQYSRHVALARNEKAARPGLPIWGPDGKP